MEDLSDKNSKSRLKRYAESGYDRESAKKSFNRYPGLTSAKTRSQPEDEADQNQIEIIQNLCAIRNRSQGYLEVKRPYLKSF